MKSAEKIGKMGVETLAEIIDKITASVQINSADVLLNNIIEELREAHRKEEIDLETFLDKVSKISYKKDLSRFLGRRRALRFMYEDEDS